MESTANEKQQKVIDSIDGIKVVDAGAGTGKTFTITKRYLNILDKSKCDLEDILLVTFTRNAAASLKEKVISSVDSSLKDKVMDAPICSFDSFCSKLVSSNGLNAPKYLGVSGKLGNYKLVTENVILSRIFKRFFNSFLKSNEEKFGKVLVSLSESSVVLNLIEELLAKGIYPTKTGWFLDGGNKVLGDKNEFMARVMEFNNPVTGKSGKIINSDLLKFFEKCLKDKKYNKSSVPVDFDSGNMVNHKLFDLAFDDENKFLVEDFIHKIYFSYIEFMAKNNYMTFSLNAMYAFLILFNDEKARKDNSFEYVMIDEFQDTNEMQFMLILLLLKSSNLCVVGDWKQGIYGFRNASIKNITEFEVRLSEFCLMIEADGVSRIGFDYSNICVEKLDFDVNYRSAQKVLDFSVASLDLPGSSSEVGSVSCVGDVVELSSGNLDFDEFSDIEFVKAESRENEINFILHKINSIVGSKMIADSKTGGSRLVKYSDIAILSRTRTFGLDILKKCEEVGCPAVYDGGIYLFLEEASIVLLAWAKLILDVDCRSSWITILEKENLPYLEIERIINDKSYPPEMIEFRKHLIGNRRVISYIVDEVFRKYGFNDEISNQIVLILDNLFNSTLISLSDLVVFIEECITNNSDFRVEISNCIDSVKIQTIHGSKGLEYPIVFVVNCNLANFPMNSRGSLKLFYDKSCGIRCKDEFSSEHNYIFDSWKSDLLSYKLNSDYDEERRLMYVAVTRAMFDVYITSYRPSTFFTEFSCGEFMVLSDNFKYNLKFPKQTSDNFDTELKISDFDDKGISRTVSAHTVMGEITISEGGRGMNFGNTIHNLAYRYVTKLDISSVDSEFEKDFSTVKKYVDSLKFSNVWGEESCMLKLSDLVSVSGIVDCVFELDDKILIVDWKTDISKENISEYRKQLSIYYHVLVESFDKPIETCIFWTYFGESEKIEPMSLNELRDLI